MKRFLFIVFFVQVFISSLLSQADTTRAIPENTIFSEREKLAFNRDQAYFNNVVKFDPTMLIRNIVFFGYDYYFSNDIALSVGAGYAYGFDPLLRINPSSTAVFGGVGTENYFNLSTIVNVKKNLNNGFAFQLAGRQYFEKDDDYMPGGYVELGYKFYYYDFSFSASDFFNSTGFILKNNQPIRIASSVLSASYGYQIHTTGKIKIVNDFVFGVGYRLSAINEITKTDYINYIGGNTAKEAAVYANKVSFGGIVINFCYTIGFGF
jgi:hypothetical protein